MYFAALQKTSLIDFPGKIAAIIFTAGCNFRCGFCHNPELVHPRLFPPPIPEEEVLDFLARRRGQLEGAVITGGEPLIHRDLARFLQAIRNLSSSGKQALACFCGTEVPPPEGREDFSPPLGETEVSPSRSGGQTKVGFKQTKVCSPESRKYSIKLDTNGSFPNRLQKLIDAKLVDYIAMDIKAPFKKYPEITAVPVDTDSIWRSIKIIKSSGLDYEFRTTAGPEFLTPDDIVEIAKLIRNAKIFVIQLFRPTKAVDPRFLRQKTYSQKELQKLVPKLKKLVKKVEIR